MSADTDWYVKVIVTKEEWREVSAITKSEALDQAYKLKDVVSVIEIKHWSEFFEIQTDETITAS